MLDTSPLERRGLFIRDKPLVSKDVTFGLWPHGFSRNKETLGYDLQGAWHQDELIDVKPSVVN
jgi:hypothetical protein